MQVHKYIDVRDVEQKSHKRFLQLEITLIMKVAYVQSVALLVLITTTFGEQHTLHLLLVVQMHMMIRFVMDAVALKEWIIQEQLLAIIHMKMEFVLSAEQQIRTTTLKGKMDNNIY